MNFKGSRVRGSKHKARSLEARKLEVQGSRAWRLEIRPMRTFQFHDFYVVI